MAELIVMGDYQGPGEQQTAETLARDLPSSWKVVFGRKLSGSRRDDLDFIVVGEHAVFLLEEKHWGPHVELGDQIWLVNGRASEEPAGPGQPPGAGTRRAVPRPGGGLPRGGAR